MIKLFINGKPRSAGSKSGFYNKKTGKIIMAPAGKYQKPWMESVKCAAIEAGYNGEVLLEGPVHLRINFCFLRPKGHFKKDGSLTKSARPYPTVKPDLTKLTRAAEDALTGLIFRDDTQVIRQTTGKDYGQPEGAEVIIEEIEGYADKNENNGLFETES